jgi:flagellar motility protein MotE (MotC chaperone)
VRQIEEISKEWVEQWSEIQQEVERTCARIAREMARMRSTLDTETLDRLKHEIHGDEDILKRLTKLREQVTGIFGHITKMGKDAELFRKDLQKLGPAAGEQKLKP